MRLQILSDLHLESEDGGPIEPAPGAELLVLAGDIDSRWDGYERFRGWPVPVLCIAGNHEFDGRELDEAWPALRERVEGLGFRLLERESCVVEAADGRRVRFVGTVRWCDFDAFGPARRERAMRAGAYFQRVMGSTLHGRPFDAAAVHEEALACRAWLEAELRRPAAGWDTTVALTHFAPSLRSADPRYGEQPGTASFCNADDDLLPRVALWIHGHLHCRFDYRVPHAAGETRVVCQARGHTVRGEADGYDGTRLIEV